MFTKICLIAASALFSSLPLAAASVRVDTSCSGTPTVGDIFTFTVPAPMMSSTTAIFCAKPADSFETLSLSFTAPPGASALSCSADWFAACSISESAGVVMVDFFGGGGIPAGMDFSLEFQGFTTGQNIAAVANAPEPRALGLLLLCALSAAIARSWAIRRWRRGIRLSAAAR